MVDVKGNQAKRKELKSNSSINEERRLQSDDRERKKEAFMKKLLSCYEGGR